jgi:hypothetical protein
MTDASKKDADTTTPATGTDDDAIVEPNSMNPHVAPDSMNPHDVPAVTAESE